MLYNKLALPFEVNQRHRAKIAFHFSFAAKEKKRPGRKVGSTIHGGNRVHHRQSSQEQWTKADKRETRWKEVARIFHAAGLQKKDTKASWHKCLKESQKKEQWTGTRSIEEEELKQFFARHKAAWESAERKTERVAEKAWQLSQGSNTKSQNLDQDLEGLMDLVKENDWDKDKAEMISL